MKTCLKYFLSMVMVASCTLHFAAGAYERDDTVYIYNSWTQIFYQEPMAMLINPEIIAYSPFSVNVFTGDEEVLRKVSEQGHIAISMGEDVWLASSDYIEHEFRGDVKGFNGYVPLFFNDKAAFLTYPSGPSFKEILFGETNEDYTIEYFNIDFENMRVKKVTHKYLSELLNDYPELKMRYEGMKDYKKSEIIEYFYLQYIDRVNQDYSKPYILDYVGPAYEIQ